MKRRGHESLSFCLAATLCAVLPAQASWWVDQSVAARFVGGASRAGPFATRAQALAYISQSHVWSMRLIPGGFDDGQIDPVQQQLELERKKEEAEREQRAREAGQDEQNGEDAAARGDWGEAANWYIQALAITPDNADVRAHLDQANTALADQQTSAAVAALRQRIEDSIVAAKIEALQQNAEDAVDAQRVAALTREAERQVEATELPKINRAVDLNKLLSPNLIKEDPDLVGSIRDLLKIQVPPPILPEEAAISFGQLGPEDDRSEAVLFLGEEGVATAKLFGSIGPAPFIGAKILFAAGNTFIADENGADLYIVRQNDTYDKALAYLKDPTKSKDFTAIVRAIKENGRISTNASIDMIRTAQAILDPKLGNSGIRIAWNALFSPEAKNSALTQACLEIGAETMGQASERMASRLLVQREPEFIKATEFLSKASLPLHTATDPATLDSLHEAVKLANSMIAESFEAVEPGATAVGEGTSLYAKWRQEHAREVKGND